MDLQAVMSSMKVDVVLIIPNLLNMIMKSKLSNVIWMTATHPVLIIIMVMAVAHKRTLRRFLYLIQCVILRPAIQVLVGKPNVWIQLRSNTRLKPV